MKKVTIVWKKAASVCLAGCVYITCFGTNVQAATGWTQEESGWKYFEENGTYLTSSWKLIGNAWYYFEENGIMSIGWKNIDNKWYYFDENGAMVSGRQKIENKWYYFDESGALVTGWSQQSGSWYYYDESGEMLIGWQRIDGMWRYFDRMTGAWIDNNEQEKGTIKGIDVSKYQQEIDWKKVKEQGIDFAFVRVGHGDQVLDPYFKTNAKGADEVGIAVGVYFYSTAESVEQAIKDAQFVIGSLQGYKISYPVAIDLEDACQTGLGKQTITDIAKAFCNEIEAAGYTPMVYCNEDWYRNYIDFSQLEGVERWIARFANAYDSTIERGIWQSGSTCKLQGIPGVVDTDFGYVDYRKIIIPRTYVVEGYQKTTGIWMQDGEKYWYRHFDGTYPKSSWELIAGGWYLFDDEGYMRTGWVLDGNEWFYLNENGTMNTGWLKEDGTWYYLAENGKLITGWKCIDEQWYYFDGAGSMITGWKYISGEWYFFDNQGVMRTGWIKDGKTWYHFAENGKMNTGWKLVDNYWYYMTNSGAMKIGWVMSNGKWYYLSSSGAMATGWVEDGTTWYYMNPSGEMMTGWICDNGSWYYLKQDGGMAINQRVETYFVGPDGKCV